LRWAEFSVIIIDGGEQVSTW